MQMIKQAPGDHLPSARHTSKHLTFINSLNHHDSSMKLLLSLFLILQMRKLRHKGGS